VLRSVPTPQRASVDPLPRRPWWQEAVFYQVYPRSFADGNGDGIGDFRGMIERLDYLADLGVDAIWLSPNYASPQFDLGYDISDYRAIAPEYGTLADFVEFLSGAHRRGIRVVLDLVLNHTSDEHAWFAGSRSSLADPKRDWYVWRDGRAGGPPNNWVSLFGTPAWEYDRTTDQYYYHAFFREQPDLNWRNPEVRQAMWEVARFWLDLGVDGFRLDAIGTIFEDPALTDHAETRSLAELQRASLAAASTEERVAVERGFQELFRYQAGLPEVHPLLKELRAVVDTYADRVLIGETDDVAFYGTANDELDLVFNFPLMRTNRLSPALIRDNQRTWAAGLPAGAWPANTLGNHDESRVRTRFGTPGHDEARARQSAALMLTLRGTPFLYNGEEIGMTDLLIEDVSLFRDNLGRWIHRHALEAEGMSPSEAVRLAARGSRDKNRTPMHWTSGANAGFSPALATTWLPVHPNHATGINVADQGDDPSSLLNWYRRLLRLRAQTPALRIGDCTFLDGGSDDVLVFLRRSEEADQTCLVVLNMSDRRQRARFAGRADRARALMSTSDCGSEIDLSSGLDIEPFGVRIGELR